VPSQEQDAPASAKSRRKRKKGGLSTRGPLLVTHRGLSGPAALKLSSFAAADLAACGYSGTLELNLAPELSRAEVASALGAFGDRVPLKAVANVNPFNIPKRLWSALVSGSTGASSALDSAATNVPTLSGAAADVAHPVDPTKPWSQLSKLDLRALEERTCRAPLMFSGKDSNKDEFVTAGGVSWSGIDSTRMESKHVKGLFFAGELLDVDGITGGHNFQSCWTTGFVAGNAAAEHCGIDSRSP
jgi:predicted flavoprotein YhiN